MNNFNLLKAFLKCLDHRIIGLHINILFFWLKLSPQILPWTIFGRPKVNTFCPIDHEATNYLFLEMIRFEARIETESHMHNSNELKMSKLRRKQSRTKWETFDSSQQYASNFLIGRFSPLHDRLSYREIICKQKLSLKNKALIWMFFTKLYCMWLRSFCTFISW